MKSKVAILMSTYNGEKYLSQQIDSIIEQDETDWLLYIRDDGSTDETQAIIRNYATMDSRIIEFGKNFSTNIGVVSSFFYLLKGIEADFYLFCDQDDIWLPNKVSDTIIQLKKSTNPALAYTQLAVVDKNLNIINNKSTEVFKTNLAAIISVDNYITGCTVGINRALRNIIIEVRDEDYDKIIMHDWWSALVAAYFGEIIYIEETTILYRQHENNVIGASSKKNILKLIKQKLISGTSIFQQHIVEVEKQLELFSKLYEKRLDKNTNRQLLSFLINEGSAESTLYKLKKAKDYKIRLAKKRYTIQYYYLILTRRILNG